MMKIWYRPQKELSMKLSGSKALGPADPRELRLKLLTKYGGEAC